MLLFLHHISIFQADVDCPDAGLCCFDGCVNTCYEEEEDLEYDQSLSNYDEDEEEEEDYEELEDSLSDGDEEVDEELDDEQDDDLDEELDDSLDEGIDEYGAPKAPIVTLEDLDSYGSPLGDALDSYGSPAAPVKGNVVISVSIFLYTFIYI